MATLLKFNRCFAVLKQSFHCRVEDTYPIDASWRNKPKVSPPADHELLPGMSPKVFRETDFEHQLGPIPMTGNAAKQSEYKNPEYFSYHNYSFYDIGRAIGCAYRTQPSALPKKGEPFRLPWQADEALPVASAGPIPSNCVQCAQDGGPYEK